jgi:single-stranded-DNA-specific exonuclease
MSNHSAVFQRLLKIRGLDESFLNPRYEDLSDPFSLPDMKPCIDRIMAAIKNQEKIIIYGDYDVDGVCSSTVMHDALIYAGCPVNDITIILPDRFAEGYGMNETAIPAILKSKASLVITVDCGSASAKVITELKKQGIDTIVTDHHEIKTPPRSAIATVNPKRKKDSPHYNLAGVGVAFAVARALNLRQNHNQLDGQEKWLLDLVAIGTICDSMPLIGENRILVYWGMRVLAKTRRLGLKELIKIAKINPKKLTTHSIAFQIGPRLNASGRMNSAHTSLNLLITKSRPKAFQLATALETLNKERRKVQDDAIAEAEATGIDDNIPVIIVKGNWHEGVIGIIAGKLTERHNKPTFVLTETEDGLLKGSGRSFGDFNLADCLTHCQSMLVKGGGHNFACGLTIANNHFNQFSTAVNNFYRSLNLKDQTRFLKTKSDLNIDNFIDLTEELYNDLQLLEPYGEGNPEPIFATTAKIFTAKVLKDKHLSLSIRDSQGRFLRLMGFFAPDHWLSLPEDATLQLKFTLALNDWNGNISVEGKIIELTVV